MIEPTVKALLEESFSLLAVELPPAWERFCVSLDGHAVEIQVDEERFVVRFEGRRPAILSPAGAADARIETSRAAILDVIDARVSLHDAVMRDAVRVAAPLAMVSRLHEGILAYVHGGVRCPSFPSLLKRFRASSARHDTEQRSKR